jgi:hypothetical protein
MSSYGNIIVFILTTYVYYIIKPSLTYDKTTDEDSFSVHLANNYAYLAIYFFMVVIFQCIVNINVIIEKCGGSTSDNIGYAGMVTIVPWTLIFGVLMIVLTMYPTFKSAFSDVIGYYYVATSANKIMNEILIDKDVTQEVTKSLPSGTSQEEIEKASNAIVKICGNSGVLVNKMTPSNFQQFWQTLDPLKKPMYKKDGEEIIKLRNQLFDLVVTKDNVGEAMWYIYTGILVTSVVQLQISSRGCSNNIKTMEKNYQIFKEKQKKQNEIKSKNAETMGQANNGDTTDNAVQGGGEDNAVQGDGEDDM